MTGSEPHEPVGDKDAGRYIILSGNPFDGFAIYGPFETEDDACSFAVNNFNYLEWWVTALKGPENL